MTLRQLISQSALELDDELVVKVLRTEDTTDGDVGTVTELSFVKLLRVDSFDNLCIEEPLEFIPYFSNSWKSDEMRKKAYES